MGPLSITRSELSFIEKLLNNMNLNSYCVPADGKELPEIDLGLRRQLAAGNEAWEHIRKTLLGLEDNTLCYYEDEFACHYFMLRLPEDPPEGSAEESSAESPEGSAQKSPESTAPGSHERTPQGSPARAMPESPDRIPPESPVKTTPGFLEGYRESSPEGFFIIGPYLTEDISDESILQMFPGCGDDQGLISVFRKYYSLPPVVSGGHPLYTVIYTLAESMWGSMSSFKVRRVHCNIPGDRPPYLLQLPGMADYQEITLKNRALEEAYYWENEIMYAVVHGQINRIESMLNNIPIGLEQRLTDKVRNMQNYTVIFNTLLRKAAESGHVPLPHIDTISGEFALRIERTGSVKALYALQKEMARKYCLLVNSYSMRGYSPVIRRVLTTIDEGLAHDLSLSTLSKQLNINASYLSSLFKKEVEMSLTDYVNQKRILQAAYLLNMTTLPIQDVAQRCGIIDVNYFTRIFRKQMGQTPTDYRRNMHRT